MAANIKLKLHEPNTLEEYIASSFYTELDVKNFTLKDKHTYILFSQLECYERTQISTAIKGYNIKKFNYTKDSFTTTTDFVIDSSIIMRGTALNNMTVYTIRTTGGTLVYSVFIGANNTYHEYPLSNSTGTQFVPYFRLFEYKG